MMMITHYCPSTDDSSLPRFLQPSITTNIPDEYPSFCIQGLQRLTAAIESDQRYCSIQQQPFYHHHCQSQPFFAPPLSHQDHQTLSYQDECIATDQLGDQRQSMNQVWRALTRFTQRFQITQQDLHHFIQTGPIIDSLIIDFALQAHPEALQADTILRDMYLDQVFVNTMNTHINGLLSPLSHVPMFSQVNSVPMQDNEPILFRQPIGLTQSSSSSIPGAAHSYPSVFSISIYDPTIHRPIVRPSHSAVVSAVTQLLLPSLHDADEDYIAWSQFLRIISDQEDYETFSFIH